MLLSINYLKIYDYRLYSTGIFISVISSENAENCISESQNWKMLWQSMSPDPLGGLTNIHLKRTHVNYLTLRPQCECGSSRQSLKGPFLLRRRKSEENKCKRTGKRKGCRHRHEKFKIIFLFLASMPASLPIYFCFSFSTLASVSLVWTCRP